MMAYDRMNEGLGISNASCSDTVCYQTLFRRSWDYIVCRFYIDLNICDLYRIETFLTLRLHIYFTQAHLCEREAYSSIPFKSEKKGYMNNGSRYSLKQILPNGLVYAVPMLTISISFISAMMKIQVCVISLIGKTTYGWLSFEI